MQAAPVGRAAEIARVLARGVHVDAIDAHVDARLDGHRVYHRRRESQCAAAINTHRERDRQVCIPGCFDDGRAIKLMRLSVARHFNDAVDLAVLGHRPPDAQAEVVLNR